jgi:hypothetical protein
MRHGAQVREGLHRPIGHQETGIFDRSIVPSTCSTTQAEAAQAPDAVHRSDAVFANVERAIPSSVNVIVPWASPVIVPRHAKSISPCLFPHRK